MGYVAQKTGGFRPVLILPTADMPTGHKRVKTLLCPFATETLDQNRTFCHKVHMSKLANPRKRQVVI